jgi:hypothetical protein
MAPTRPPSPRRRQRRRLLLLTVGVAVLATAAGILAYVETRVMTGGGSWHFQGRVISSLPISAICSDCDRTISPGTSIVIHLSVTVGVPGGCQAHLDCPGYQVYNISVSAPYTLVGVTPASFPQFLPAPSSQTWTMTVRAPANGGFYGLGGTITI